MNIQKFKQRFFEIIRFGFAGGVSFLLDFGVMVFLKEVLKFDYLIAAGLSFTLSVILNYFLCVLWAFKGADKTNKKAMVLFVITSVVGLGFNQLFMWLFVDLAKINYMISKVITTVLVMVWNYITKRQALVKKGAQ